MNSSCEFRAERIFFFFFRDQHAPADRLSDFAVSHKETRISETFAERRRDGNIMDRMEEFEILNAV